MADVSGSLSSDCQHASAGYRGISE